VTIKGRVRRKAITALLCCCNKNEMPTNCH
jgi:hypothetical protein